MIQIKGMDISTLYELERLGVKFYDDAKEQDLYEILKRYGVNYIRLRLWNDPYSPSGEPYGAGTNDLATTIALAKRALAAGMGFLLDYHYSDFWADPGKQHCPKAWRGYSQEQLEEAVYSYTRDTMLAFIKEGVEPTMVQVGNELTNGLLWPLGKMPQYDAIAKFVSAGIRAVKEVSSAKIMIHLDNGGNNALYRDWFDHYRERGEDFDIIGLSYYPFWHGTLDQLTDNMKDILARYQKDLVVAEVSMGYTMEDYAEYEQLPEGERKGYATRPELIAKIEYPMTIQGQCDFLKDFFGRIREVGEDHCLGYFYWEPAWIPCPHSGWATPASLEYLGEKGPCGNEWANQALFDYKGNALPSLGVVYHEGIGDC